MAVSILKTRSKHIKGSIKGMPFVVNFQIFRVSPFFKLQNNTETVKNEM